MTIDGGDSLLKYGSSNVPRFLTTSVGLVVLKGMLFEKLRFVYYPDTISVVANQKGLLVCFSTFIVGQSINHRRHI